MTNGQIWLTVAIIAGITLFLRGVPFLIFARRGQAPPGFIQQVGELLQPVLIGLLIIYCLRDTVIFSAPYALPELFAIGVVIGFHYWKGNMLLSIGGGTSM